ncbi:MAG TPA: carboxypeptidase-like regulatory domain-containing protein [Allosphingosinicella sp.]|nr:carboxypeptidase-like regulatory domain-containing protein [Allosphingosinicella sp.]
MLGLAASLLLAAAAPAELAGDYVLHQPETASGLRLQKDGRFQWYLSQGALDLAAEGGWTRAGDTLILTTPSTVPPSFSLISATRTTQPELVVRVENPAGAGIQGIDILLRYAAGEAEVGHTDGEGGCRFELKQGGKPQYVALAIGMFEFRSPDFAVDSARANVLTFRLQPNDLGKQSFAGEPVRIVEEGLELVWRGQRLVYRRAGQ